jgi:ABC-2 type transport system ATP-binding protein
VLLQGQDLYQQPRILGRQLGYLPDRPPLYPELYVDEYLNYCADLHAMSANKRKAACAQVKQACGLEKHGRSLIGALSRGYQQRLGIAQALIHDPPLIILDEPTVALDPIQLHEIRHLIKGLAARHAVIFSTHLLSEAQAICSHVAIINHGRLRHYTSLSLWQRAPEDQWEVAFRQPPTLTQLQQLLPEASIQQQERADATRFLIQSHQDPTTRIVMQSVEEQWALYELTPHRLSLEQRFLELLEHDQGHTPS